MLNKSSKDRTWSAVPVALLGQFGLVVEREQGRGPKEPMSYRTQG